MEYCPICLFSQDVTLTPAYLDCCDHCFHFDCILRWSNVASSCPLCIRNISFIFYKGFPYPIEFKLQELSDDEDEDERTPVIINEEEQRRRSMIRKQARLLNEASVTLRRRREEEQKAKALERIRQQQEFMSRAWEDFRRLKAPNMKAPENTIKQSNQNSRLKSPFLRALVDDPANNAEFKDTPEPATKPVKRVRSRKAKAVVHAMASESPSEPEGLDAALIDDLDLENLRKLLDDKNLAATFLKVDDVIRRISLIPYCSDSSLVRRLLDSNLVGKLLELLTFPDVKIQSRNKEVLLRVINSIPLQRKYIPAAYADVLRPIVDRVVANRDGASVEERRMAAVASNIMREWSEFRS